MLQHKCRVHSPGYGANRSMSSIGRNVGTTSRKQRMIVAERQSRLPGKIRLFHSAHYVGGQSCLEQALHCVKCRHNQGTHTQCVLHHKINTEHAFTQRREQFAMPLSRKNYSRSCGSSLLQLSEPSWTKMRSKDTISARQLEAIKGR